MPQLSTINYRAQSLVSHLARGARSELQRAVDSCSRPLSGCYSAGDMDLAPSQGACASDLARAYGVGEAPLVAAAAALAELDLACAQHMTQVPRLARTASLRPLMDRG